LCLLDGYGLLVSCLLSFFCFNPPGSLFCSCAKQRTGGYGVLYRNVPSFPPPKYDVSRAGTAWLPCQQPVPPGHVGYWGSVHLYKHVILLRAAAMAQGRGLKRGDAIDSWMGLMGSVEMEFGRRKKEMRNTLRFSCLEPLVPSGLFLTVFLCNPPSLQKYIGALPRLLNA
jgi:hypothetical protein